ncbi:MAG: hypothetical protein CSA22_04610 [Deltaproteobacteria bacterium]|nr:MAG: hypothetical protein CSA22_04610 [Deltaproteobacteria bacterium]
MTLIIGIAFERDAVSGIAATSTRHECRVHRTARVMIPPDETDDPHLPLAKACTELRAALQITDARHVRYHIALPAAEFSFRILDFPFSQTAKIREALTFELEPHLPVSMEDMTIAWAPLSTPLEAKGARIMAAAILSGTLRTYEAAWTSAGIQPTLVTIAGYVAGWAHSHAIPGTASKLLIAANDSVASCMLLEHRQVTYFRSIGLQNPQKGGGGDGAALSRRVSQVYPVLIDRMADSEVHPDGLLMAVREADTGLRDTVAATASLPLETVSLEAAYSVHVDETVSTPGETLIALALIPVLKPVPLRFLSTEGRVRKLFEEHPGQWVATLVLAVLFLIVSGFHIWQEVGDLYQKEAALDAEIQSLFTGIFPEAAGVRDPFKQADYVQVRLNEKRKQRADGEEGVVRPPAIELLAEISRRIPASVDVEISRLMLTERSLDLSGHTQTYGTVDELQNRLAESPLFADVVITSATNEPSGGVRFKLKLSFAAEGGSGS